MPLPICRILFSNWYKSSKIYNVIEDAATQMKGALKAKDKAKALKGLQTLGTNIAVSTK
ncbi:hypothetical protein LC609_10180 [Nostoc sp. XA013]|nr:hypothetical protein [Nostoc sp. XA013]